MFRFLVLRQSFSKKLWSCSVGFQLSEFRWRCFRDGYIRILPGKIPMNLPAALQGPCLSTSVLIWQRSFCSATVVKALGTWALGHLALCICCTARSQSTWRSACVGGWMRLRFSGRTATRLPKTEISTARRPACAAEVVHQKILLSSDGP